MNLIIPIIALPLPPFLGCSCFSLYSSAKSSHPCAPLLKHDPTYGFPSNYFYQLLGQKAVYGTPSHSLQCSLCSIYVLSYGTVYSDRSVFIYIKSVSLITAPFCERNSTSS